MPKRMPRYDLALATYARSAVAIAEAGELSHRANTAVIRKAWSTPKVEALYELAFLRVFITWEMYLEAVFYRTLCGFASVAGQEQLARGQYFRTVAAAEADVLGRGTYAMWYKPATVIDRCKKYIVVGTGSPCLQESVLTSSRTRLEHFAATRHRIVHHQTDAKINFNTATLSISGRTYDKASPGKFLRDYDATKTPPQRWLEVAVTELSSLMAQMV